ncbi:dUTP diphosphatase [Candidatus Woesearchaeota archaeon]|nr:MAG: dUTP diphosphatase [Candidatus Woesearchaeota archaeon]
MSHLSVKFSALADDVVLPSYAHEGDAGLDLRSRELKTLNPGEPELFKLGFALALPPGYVGIVKDRSSLGKRGITTLAGVIDHTYRGEYCVVLVNVSQAPYTVRPGDKIAQLLVLPVATVAFERVKDLPETTRGTGGFGSTGR